MLKIDFNIFDSFLNWENNKKETLFKNEKQLLFYQNQALKKLLKNKHTHRPVYLCSSGTTSNRPKRYRFPKNIYDLIENHHIWRIMNSHDIVAGNVVKIFQGTQTNSTNVLIGPKKNSSLGTMNDCWELIYDPLKTDHKFWIKTISFIKDLRPKFLYTSPSVFESFHKETNFNFDFPVIFSCEVLTDDLRKKSNIIFSRTIDKMRDWTTGFGFFECKFGTKHIYDELCLAEQIENNRIKCTDFFNYCELFVDKVSDDLGKINKKLCNCGIYGSFLENFEGKFFECLVSISGRRYSANYVSNFLSSQELPKLDGYQIFQDEQKNIKFIIKDKIEDCDALRMANAINKIIMDEDTDKTLNLFNQDRHIHRSSTTNINLFFKQGNFNINKNKKISLKSMAK